MTNIEIQQTSPAEVSAMQAIAGATGLFPPEMLPAMIAPSFQEPSTAFWLSAYLDDPLSGFAYCRAEEMTDSTWNLLAIAVSPDVQKRGIGSNLVKAVEDRLRREGQRLLLIDTSGTPEFDHVHRFYGSLGFTLEARIGNYWAAGDDKVTFSKPLI